MTAIIAHLFVVLVFLRLSLCVVSAGLQLCRSGWPHRGPLPLPPEHWDKRCVSAHLPETTLSRDRSQHLSPKVIPQESLLPGEERGREGRNAQCLDGVFPCADHTDYCTVEESDSKTQHLAAACEPCQHSHGLQGLPNWALFTASIPPPL